MEEGTVPGGADGGGEFGHVVFEGHADAERCSGAGL